MKMNERTHDKLGAFLCKILRHAPKEYGITVDEYGYCSIDDLAKAISEQEFWSGITADDIVENAKNDKKQRYALEGNKIKATYGHSIPVIMPMIKRELPPILYHGTNERNLNKISHKREGLLPMERLFVHLSETEDFAILAAKRRRKPVLVRVDVEKALGNKVVFQFAGNKVWLATPIPAECVEVVRNL